MFDCNVVTIFIDWPMPAQAGEAQYFSDIVHIPAFSVKQGMQATLEPWKAMGEPNFKIGRNMSH